MTITSFAKQGSSTRGSGRKGSPDEVPSEFPERRRREPGPDDVYDPDSRPRHHDSGSSPWFEESGSGGAWDVLF
jgi:hypothetical protein